MSNKTIAAIKKLSLVILFFGVGVACTTKEDEVVYRESVKDISGNWQVVQAFRNEQDITEMMDFSKFRVQFNADGTYGFENYLPFLVREGGTWSLDDPQYPMFLELTSGSSEAPVKTGLNMPIKDGKRQLGLTFSPGCSSNTYTYLFEKVE